MKKTDATIGCVLCFAIGVCVSLIACLLFFGTIQEPTQEVKTPQPIERIKCGTCGASVTDWWFTRNDANTEWVAVCGKCYDAIEDGYNE